MQLQPNEKIIVTSNGENVILSNLRICSVFKEWGHSSSTFIYLEDVSSIQSVYKSSVVLQIFAAISGLSAAWLYTQQLEQQAFVGIGACLICLFLWFVTRKRVISIHPNGGKPIEFEATGLKDGKVEDFIERLLLAKSERINEIYKC